MESSQKICFDLLIFGNCTKRKDCSICKDNISLKAFNLGAKEFKPKGESKPQFSVNLGATEYLPSSQVSITTKQENNESPLSNKDIPIEDNGDDFDELSDEMADDEAMEKIYQIIDNEIDNESDDEKWFPKFENCECCKGFIYQCKGETCKDLGVCFCKVKNIHDEIDDYE